MNVLSLFDGMSNGQIALNRAGIKVDKYFASEIDKYAIQVTMANYPDTIQLGSVTELNGYDLPKIDLLIGGSPCQSFSFAGKRKGMATKCEIEILNLDQYLTLKKEGYEFEGQSYLFWEYMRLLNECKPTYFLLENVEMGEKWETILSKSIGVNGIHINSALVSAQNRKRIYWTNIGMLAMGLFGYPMSIIEQPKDKGILLRDVLETDVAEKYFLSEKMITGLQTHSDKKQSEGCGFKFEPTYCNRKSKILTTKPGTRTDDNYIVHNTMPRSSTTGKGGTGPLSRNDGKTYCLDTGNTNAIEINVYDGYNNRMRNDEKCGSITQHCSREGMTNGFKVVVPNTNAVEIVGMDFRYDEGFRKRGGGKSPTLTIGNDSSISGNALVLINYLNDNQSKKFNPNINSDKANALTLAQGRAGSSSEYMDTVSKIANITSRIRRLTPTECERLQTVPDNYTAHVSDSQRYKMLGNGWTVDVVAHIFSYLE